MNGQTIPIRSPKDGDSAGTSEGHPIGDIAFPLKRMLARGGSVVRMGTGITNDEKCVRTDARGW